MEDSDVRKQIQHMMAFIEQEANEKAEEIDAKAEEEFNIEKGRLVQNQRIKIIEYYERKEKQIELRTKIQSSNMLNQARLKVLKAQEEHCRQLLENAKIKLKAKGSDATLIENLIIQALFQLLEKTVVLQCRQQDEETVKSVLPNCIQTYTNKTGMKCQVDVDSNYLPSDCAGGICLSAAKGRIRVDNTLEARLDMIASQMMPEIRTQLFGGNKNRKFFD